MTAGWRAFPLPMFVALIALSNVNPFGSDSPLVAFPQMARELGTTSSAVSLTFSSFLVGLAVGTLLLGPVSDARGRRFLLVGGPLVFAALSVGCAFADRIELLLVLRAGQGFASAASAVAARAAVSDWVGPDRAARPFALLAAGAFLAPLLAPVLGAGLLSVGDWRTVFLGMAVIGLVYAAAAFLLVPETLPPDRRDERGGRRTMARLGITVRRPGMGAALLASGLAMGAHNAYVASSPFVVQTLLGSSPFTYTLFVVTNSLVMVVAALAFARLAGRIRAELALLGGLLLGCVSSLTLTFIAAAGLASLASVWACLLAGAVAMGIEVPTSTVVIQRLGSPLQGTSAALQGFSRYLIGAAISPVPVFLGANAIVGLGALRTSLLVVATALAWWVAHSIRTRGRREDVDVEIDFA